VTVGETLTEARCQAGLSVDEVSERTRIRPTVIRSIEQDDYAACGGEIYVRGYVRAIAGAVGIDALPLIREFDQAQLGGAEEVEWAEGDVPAPQGLPGVPDSDVTRFDLSAVPGAGPADDSDVTRFDLPAVPGAGPADDSDVTRFDLPAVPAFDPPADPDATRFDLPLISGPPFDAHAEATAPFGEMPLAAFPPAAFPHARPPRDFADTRLDLGTVTDDDLMAAGYQLPGSQAQGWPGPPWQSAPPPPVPPAAVRHGEPAGGRQRAIAYTALAAVAAAAVVVLAVHLAGGGTATHAVAGASPAKQAAAPGGSASASAAARASAAAEASAAAKASKSAAAKAAALAHVTHLPVAAARAFGPDGFADGDNAGLAGYTIAAKPAEIWSTQWYATADFGLLKHGTGLLLDLGSQLTITGVRFDLTQYRGASLEIKVGNGTTPQSLRIAASVQGASGVVRVALPHPQLARYLVIWFTLLAPDGAGHFQESVSHVAVAGHR
jgi:hypothetical protein